MQAFSDSKLNFQKTDKMSQTQIHKYLTDSWYYLVPAAAYLGFWLFWFWIDNTPPHWDSGRHVFNAENYFTLFRNSLLSTKENGMSDAFSELLQKYFYYPPFQYYLSVCLSLFVGISAKKLLLTNLLWIAGLTFGATKFLKCIKVSNLGIFVGLCLLFGSPFLIGQSREYQLDYSVLIFLFLSFWRFVLLVRDFNYRNSFWLGAIFGLGVLTKWTFGIVFLVMLIPFGLVVIKNQFENQFTGKILNSNSKNEILDQHKTEYKTEYIIQNAEEVPQQKSQHNPLKSWGTMNTIKRFLAVSSLGLIVSWAILAPWYVSNLSHLIRDFASNASNIGVIEGDPQGITLASLGFYINVLTEHYLTLVWLVILASLGILCFQKLLKNIYLQGLLFSFALLTLTLMNQGNKDTRYAIGYFVVFTALIGLGLDGLPSLLKKIMVGLTILASLFSLINLNFWAEQPAVQINLWKDKIKLTTIAKSGYTNLTTGNRAWAVYPALTNSEQIADKYMKRSDSCVSKDYWKPLPTIKVDFEYNTTHTNVGTVWGLAREYGLEWTNYQDACFVLLDEFNTNYKISEYLRSENPYTKIGSFQGFEQNLVTVLAKD